MNFLCVEKVGFFIEKYGWIFHMYLILKNYVVLLLMAHICLLHILHVEFI